MSATTELPSDVCLSKLRAAEQRAEAHAERDTGSFLSKIEAAKRLRVTPRTLETYMTRGIVPFYRIGGRTIRFRVGDLDAAMEKFRVA